jgi:6-phosphogluconolactonase (cycloisomerase 2 family)
MNYPGTGFLGQYMNLSFNRTFVAFLLATTLGAIACGGGSGKADSPTPGVSGVHSAYVANAGSGDISEYAIDDKGVLHIINGSPMAISANATALTMTPDGNFLYAMDPVKKVIVELSINSSSGVLTSVGTQTTASTPSSMAMDSKGKFLYVGNSANSLSIFAIGSDGKLTETSFSPVALNGPVQSVTVSPKGTYLFASVPSTGVFYEFSLDATSGMPTQVAGSPVAIGNPKFVAVAPNEAYAIVIDQSGLINRLEIVPGTGALAVAAFSPFNAGVAPDAAVIDSTSTYVYVITGLGKAIATLSFQTNGAPFQVTNTIIGNSPAGMALSSTFMYAVAAGDNTISEFSVAAGLPTAISPVTLATGTTPSALVVR